MKKILIMPDSFKGSMSSEKVSDFLEKQITDSLGNVQITKVPIADGGEGSVDCLLRTKAGKKVYAKVQNPEGKEIEAFYGILENGTAIIEIAESSGLTKQTSFQAMTATTYGFGQLIQHGLEKGAREFLLCLGGSATTDGGCGMAAALGVRFLDENQEGFVPTGATLCRIHSIDFSDLDERVKESRFTVMSDVENPLYGENGAAYVYAGQKGANPAEQELLDQGLRHFCKVLEDTLGIDYRDFQGGGAAGGAGLGCVVFLGAKLQSGIDTMLDFCGFDELMKDCDLVVTGEGKLDRQSLMGKVLHGICRRAQGKPVVSFCGTCEIGEEELSAYHVTAVEIGRGVALEESMKNGDKYLCLAAERFFNGGFVL